MIFSFFQDLCPFGSSRKRLLTMCHTVTQALSTFAVIIGYVNGMNKNMPDLYKKLESQEREKREKMDSK